MFCTHCGNEVNDPTQKYCELCGEILTKEELPKPQVVQDSEINTLKQEVDVLKREADLLKRESKSLRYSRWGFGGNSCCYCYVAMVIFGIIISIIIFFLVSQSWYLYPY
ncbi:MAG: hypothetical protein ACFFAS_04235 [Promethearchaeota archaeon]